MNFKPGDVICIGTTDAASWWIRLRSRLMRQPALQNHIAMFTHYDSDGSPRGLEGRPSSFGWVNLNKYLEGPRADTVVTNAGKTDFSDEDRSIAVERARQMIAMPYDWEQIIFFALSMVSRRFRAAEWPEDGLPSSSTCASSLDLLYEAPGWPNPGDWRQTRGTDVDDWVTHIRRTWP